MKLLLLLVFFLWGRDSGGGGVSGQLYTNFLDNAKDQNLPLAYSDSNDGGTSKKTDAEKETLDLRTLTCMAFIPTGWNAYMPYVAETRDFFRARTVFSNGNPHYFCSNVPRFHRGYGSLKGVIQDGHVTPHSKFWKHEPTAWHWAYRTDLNPVATAKNLMDAKDMGFIFTVQVTGIKSKGRFLKGWYHLKIELGIDHNIKDKSAQNTLSATDPFLLFVDDTKRKAAAQKYKDKFVIDKLMVTARGRILIPGKPQPATDEGGPGPPRRAWVGGIGEFVQDFPKCKEDGYNSEYVTQQFMPCGAVQFSESKYGNNFYYSRGKSGGDAKYGKQGVKVKTFHLNFRLDNTFCNRYYDLDFIANGMVMDEGTPYDAKGIDLGGSVYPPNPHSAIYGNPLQPIIYAVQRSVSTRFVFISSYKDHGPTYYENAEPVPRGGESVDCSLPLKGVHSMTDAYVKPVFKGTVGEEMSNDKPPEGHTTSVTEGAALQPNTDHNKDGSSFGGSIKFIYPLPTSDELLSVTDHKNFAGRRTWTYPDAFIIPSHGLGDGPNSFWDGWTDWKEFKASDGRKVHTENPTRPTILTAVQRVLNEFDWESWRARSRQPKSRRQQNIKAPYTSIKRPKSWQYAGFPKTSSGGLETTPKACAQDSYKNGVCQGWCNVHGLANHEVGLWNSQVEYWPHPYYDVTCVGLEFDKHGSSGGLRNLVFDIYPKNPPSYKDVRGGTDYQKKFPPILGRCRSSLQYNPGIGSLYNAPPPCDQFFGDHKAGKIAEPALGTVRDSAEKSEKMSWFDKYGEGGSRGIVQTTLCNLADALNKKFPKCPSIPPNPRTVAPDPTDPKVIQKKNKEKKDFRRTKAYSRGMMVAECPYSLYVYDSRVLHGLVMTIIVMFITPVSIFLARYFKETFMDSRVFLHRIWYFIHLGASILIPLLFIVAMYRLVEARALLGVSLSQTGAIHRLLGWVAILIAILLAFLGGIRCMNRGLRAIIILFHFLLGFAFYFISLGLVMVSVAIPGSPSCSKEHDFSIIGTPNSGEKSGEMKYLVKEPVFLILIGWIIFDLAIHIFMTVMQCINDKKMKLTQPRICFGAGMPVLMENFRFDSPGRFMRIWALRLYVVVALGVTIAICALIRLNSPRGKGLGFMSCTHSDTKEHEVLKEYGPDCIRKD